MASRVVLHIGMMKSGTTFIQRRLSANPGILEQQGVTFPHPWNNQVAAVSDFVGARRAKKGAWDELVAEVNRTPGTVLLSMEFLVNAPVAKIASLPETFPGASIQSVVTVRDLGRSVPAMWQESLQNRSETSWPKFLREIQGGLGRGRTFWRQQRADRIVERWVEGLGGDRVTIVTVPPPSAPPELLWERFCEAVGLGPADWTEGLRANESLGVRSALLMGLLNEHFADVDKGTYNRKVKVLGKFVLAERRKEEPKIGFVVPDWLHEIAREVNASLAASGARVIGDLADLEPHDVPGVDPSTVTTEELLEVAVDTLAKVMDTPAPRRAKLARQALNQQ